MKTEKLKTVNAEFKKRIRLPKITKVQVRCEKGRPAPRLRTIIDRNRLETVESLSVVETSENHSGREDANGTEFGAGSCRIKPRMFAYTRFSPRIQRICFSRKRAGAGTEAVGDRNASGKGRVMTTEPVQVVDFPDILSERASRRIKIKSKIMIKRTAGTVVID